MLLLLEEHIQVLYERYLLGSSTAGALLNTGWFNNTIQVYGEKRPAEMKTDDAPFYLAVNNVKSGSCKPWFKKAPVGLNKLNTLMKTMALKTGLGPQRQKNCDSNFSQQ